MTKLMITIPDWFLIFVAVHVVIMIFLEIRKGTFAKKKLRLEQERFEYEKQIKQYAKAIADAERIANTPKHSRR